MKNVKTKDDIVLKDYDLYIAVIDKKYEYKDYKGCVHFLFHTKTV